MKGRTVIQKGLMAILFGAVLPVFVLWAGIGRTTMLAQHLDVRGLTLKAAKVVEAKCVSVEEDSSSPNLIYTFQVTRMLKGRKRTSTVKVRIPGGHLGNHNLYVPGVTNAAPQIGETMLLFLGSYERGYFPVGYWRGMKRVAKDSSGREMVEVEKGRWLPLSQVRETVLQAVRGASE